MGNKQFSNDNDLTKNYSICFKALKNEVFLKVNQTDIETDVAHGYEYQKL